MIPDDQPGRADRTWLCSVLFADIVDYSEQSVQTQMQWKDRFNHYLGDALRSVPEVDRVILDTGDGAAVCFLGDPEPAMFCALKLLGSLVTDEKAFDKRLQARLGINLGPVKLVKDINGKLNALGDGINVAQRVMSFAGQNHILVSRSFYEVANRLSESYQQLFRFAGTHKDKHVREHTVYELMPPGSTDGAQPPAPEPQPTPLPVSVPTAIASVPSAGRSVNGAQAPSGAIENAAGSPPGGEPVLWDEKLLEEIRHEVATFVGPVARVMVRRAALRARTPEELRTLVADGIPSPLDRREFLRAGRGKSR